MSGPKHFVNDPIASTLTSASIGFARRAIELAHDCSWRGVGEFTDQHRTQNRRAMEYTIGAVIVAVASVEGMINEMLAGSADGFTPRGNLHNVSDASYARWALLWNEGVFDRGLNAVDKCQVALAAADLPQLSSDRKAVEDMKALVALRNELVHSGPKFRPHGSDVPQQERDLLERRLASKFPQNDLVQKYSPFIWQRCLGVGCA